MAWNQHEISTFPSNWDQNNIWAYNQTTIIRAWRQATCGGCLQPFSTQDNTQISCYECRHNHPFGAVGDGCPGPLRDTDSFSSHGRPPSPPEGDGSPSDENSLSEEGSPSEEGSHSEEESESESSDSSEQSLLSTESTPFTTGNHTSSSSTKESSSSSDTDDADADDVVLNIASDEDSDVGTDEDSDEDSDDGSNEDKGEEGDSAKPKHVKWPTNMEERLECDLDELFWHGY